MNNITSNNLIIGKKFIEKRGKFEEKIILVAFCICNSIKYCVFYDRINEKYLYPIEIDEYLNQKLKYFRLNHNGTNYNKSIYEKENIINGLKKYNIHVKNNSNKFFNNFSTIGKYKIENEPKKFNKKSINNYRKTLLSLLPTIPKNNSYKNTTIEFKNNHNITIIPGRTNKGYISHKVNNNSNLTKEQKNSLHKPK
jgi:hydroxymethylpyrimidine pyrophosphatase-like HAD family hydrolase